MNVENLPGYIDEMKLLKVESVRRYYEHLRDNVELDRTNPQNSYVMYAWGKVDVVDTARAPRFIPARSAMPDIDTDFPIAVRDKVIEYLRSKYGEDKVCRMATFGRMQAKGALKDVLRARGQTSFEEMNAITEFIPDESKIADELQEMLEEEGESSTIKWALENYAEELSDWVTLREDGELEGPKAQDFAQAIRLEGTKRSIGKHASGVIVSSVAIGDVVPLVYDKSERRPMVGVDMRDAEDMGLVKFDLLSLRALDAISDAEAVIRTGRLPTND